MHRKLQAFLRQEREEIAAVLPALFGERRWPGEIWLMLVIALAMAAWAFSASWRASASVLLLLGLAGSTQLLLTRARGGPLLRAYGMLVLFIAPGALVAATVMAVYFQGEPPSRADQHEERLRDACLARGSAVSCRKLLQYFPVAFELLDERQQLQAWKTARRPISLGDYPPGAREVLLRKRDQMLSSFQERQYEVAHRLADELLLKIDSEFLEVEFYRLASALGARHHEQSKRHVASASAGEIARKVSSLEKDGEALRWKAATDRRARERMLLIADQLRALQPGNEKALEWMRQLGIRK